MISAKQGHYWYHFYQRLWYDAVLDWGMNPGPPAPDASTLPDRMIYNLSQGIDHVMLRICYNSEVLHNYINKMFGQIA